MQHEAHSSHNSPGFGKNTNGLGILIIAVVFVGITLFCWHLWNNNDKEAAHYRLPETAVSDKADQGTGH